MLCWWPWLGLWGFWGAFAWPAWRTSKRGLASVVDLLGNWLDSSKVGGLNFASSNESVSVFEERACTVVEATIYPPGSQRGAATVVVHWWWCIFMQSERYVSRALARSPFCSGTATLPRRTTISNT